jgi:hypothetical protein
MLFVQSGDVALLTLQNYGQEFPRPATEELLPLHLLVALFIIPIGRATMSAIAIIVQEKDSRVQTMSSIMGCSEAAYWGVFFASQLIMAFTAYTVRAYSISRRSILIGIDFP